MKRLHELCSSPAPNLDDFVPRGDAWQRSQRQRERDLRCHIAALANSWTDLHGLTYQQIAASLDLNARTLRQWLADDRAARSHVPCPRPLPLGRPVLRSPCEERCAVLALLTEFGLGTGVPTLCACFPNMPRAELDDILRRARRVCRQRYHQTQRVLHWTTPGSVWAMDFTETPAPIDGLYPYLLAVRDLASGAQLLAWPLRTATAPEAIRALDSLVARHGAPLVLKTDNGSPFCAADTQDFLRQHHLSGPTPDQAWQARPTITHEERTIFQTSVNRIADEVRAQDGWPTTGPLQAMAQRAVDRLAIQRALVEREHFLPFSRHRDLQLLTFYDDSAMIMQGTWPAAWRPGCEQDPINCRQEASNVGDE